MTRTAELSTVSTGRWGYWALNLLALAFLVTWAAFLVPRMMSVPGVTDAEAYWRLDLDNLYGQPGVPGAFLYSPVVAQVLAPFTALPLSAFYAGILALNLSALVYMLGPIGGAVAVFVPFVNRELQYGNVHLLIAAAIVLGFRHRAWWACLPLTKVTPGIALLYDWRHPRRMVAPLAMLAGIVALSALLAPHLWVEWIDMLRTASGDVPQLSLWTHTPVAVRAAVAVPLMLLAGWRQRPAAVPLIVLFAIPVAWHVSLCIGLAAVPLLYPRNTASATHRNSSELA